MSWASNDQPLWLKPDLDALLIRREGTCIINTRAAVWHRRKSSEVRLKVPDFCH